MYLKPFYVSVVQGISTGKYHAAVMTNSEQWELACVRAGRSSGDLAHPLVYCPELHFSEFTSAMADMKNSVAVSGELQIHQNQMLKQYMTNGRRILMHFSLNYNKLNCVF